MFVVYLSISQSAKLRSRQGKRGQKCQKVEFKRIRIFKRLAILIVGQERSGIFPGIDLTLSLIDCIFWMAVGVNKNTRSVFSSQTDEA